MTKLCKCGNSIHKNRNFRNTCSRYCMLQETTAENKSVIDDCLWCGKAFTLSYLYRNFIFCSSKCGENARRKPNWLLFNIFRILSWSGPKNAEELSWYLDEFGFRATTRKVSHNVRILIKKKIVSNKDGVYSIESQKNANEFLKIFYD